MPTAIWMIVVALVAAAVGFLVGRAGGLSSGRAQGRTETEDRLRSAARAVARGGLPEGAEPGSAEAELHEALRQGWTPRDEERQLALREALGRVGAFLEEGVRAHLAGADPDADAGELRERIGRALGSLEDLEFFLVEPGTSGEPSDLSALVQQVTREFAHDQSVSVRVSLDERRVRADVNARAFMDALYLVLHNAGRFGGGSTVDVTVAGEDGRATVRVRDRGQGFSEDALKRAFDPFYSTAADGLGLGLPHARKAVEGMGGRIDVRNVPGNGGEVEISFPTK
jgi:signal transduction histidine kinase